MRKERNQETRFSAPPPYEASFASRHLSAEVFVNPEQEADFIKTHGALAAQPPTPRAINIPILQPAGNGQDLRARASGGLASLVLFISDAFILGAIGATIGYSTGGPIGALVGGLIGAAVGGFFSIVLSR